MVFQSGVCLGMCSNTLDPRDVLKYGEHIMRKDGLSPHFLLS